MRNLLLLLSAGLLLLGGCTSENGEDLLANEVPAPACNTADATYALTVAPLMQAHCTTCHKPGFTGSGVQLTNYAQVRAVALNGSLVGSVSHDPRFSAMPQGAPKLPECDINRLRQWVANGAPDN